MSKEKIYWTTKTGKQIDIDDMDIDHLRNTLKMLVREDFIDFGKLNPWEDMSVGDLQDTF